MSLVVSRLTNEDGLEKKLKDDEQVSPFLLDCCSWNLGSTKPDGAMPGIRSVRSYHPNECGSSLTEHGST